MPMVLAKRLGRFIALTYEERALLAYMSEPAQAFSLGDHILSDQAGSSAIYIIVEGFACEYRVLRDGGKQIIRLLIPGDTFNDNAAVLRVQNSSFVAQSNCRVAAIQEQAFDRLMRIPRLAKAWTQAAQLDCEALLESMVRLGRRSALARTAHFLCETQARMRMTGLCEGNVFAFPLIQQELADVLGLSAVHTNRNLRTLVDVGSIEYAHKRITVLNKAKLSEIGDFSGSYLSPPSETEIEQNLSSDLPWMRTSVV